MLSTMNGCSCWFRCAGLTLEVVGSLANLTELRLDNNQLTGNPVTFVFIRLVVPLVSTFAICQEQVGFQNPLPGGRVNQNFSTTSRC